MTKEKEIYLIRHLATKMNKDGVYIGRKFDPPILKGEISEFRHRLRRLAENTSFSKVSFYSSPTKRCQQTIKIVRDMLGFGEKPINLEEGFNETDLGGVAGCTGKQAREKFPQIIDMWMKAPQKVKFPGGETYKDVQERTWMNFQKIMKEDSESQTIFICSHVDMIKMLLFKILDAPISAKRAIVIPSGSISTIVLSTGELKVKSVNI